MPHPVHDCGKQSRMRRAYWSLLAAFVFLAGCPPKKYVLLSPEDNYSDDPSLVVQVESVLETEKGKTEVALAIDNRREQALALADVDAVLLDADERPMRLVAKPSDEIAPSGSKTVTYVFDTTGASKGALELQLKVPGVKVWPIIFSTEKPPDFKPTPEPMGGGQGPGPGPM